MKNALSIILPVLALLALLDGFCALAWAFSGQIPADGFYCGALSVKLVSLFW